MSEKYTVVVEITRGKMKPRLYRKGFNLNYNDDTFQECENLIRDTLKDVANSFINESFYD